MTPAAGAASPAGAGPAGGTGSPGAGWPSLEVLASRYGSEVIGAALERAIETVMAPPAARSLDATGLTTLVTALPWTVLSGAVVATLGSAVAPVPAGPVAAVAVWLAGGVLVMDRRVERAMVRLMYHGRRPDPAEQAAIDAAWAAVAARAGIDPDRFELWVEPSEDLNAYATGGHVIMVTSAAAELTAPSLTAILAHELGHHIGGHAWTNLLAAYLGFPGRLFATGVLTIAETLASLDRSLDLAVKAGAVVVVLVAPWTLLFVVLPPVKAAADRRSEFASDRFSADLGYGADLLALLGWFAERQAERARAGNPTPAEGLMDHHPSVRRRMVALTGYLARGVTGLLPG